MTPQEQIDQLKQQLAQANAGLHAFRSFVCITPTYPLNSWFEERDKLLNNDFGMGVGWLSTDEAKALRDEVESLKKQLDDLRGKEWVFTEIMQDELNCPKLPNRKEPNEVK